jgi:hypothetical protein
MVNELLRALPIAALAFHAACATAPKPTAGSQKIRANAPAVVEGRVHDLKGRPAAGLRVRGIPRGADIPWTPWTTTGCDGSFRLSLAAPGSYGFLLAWNETALITPSAEDPARLQVAVEPGEIVRGVELVFLGSEWRRLMEGAPADTPSCP